MSDSSDLTGNDIGRYHIVSMIGTGGMGQVYDAIDPSLGRHVAIKILKRESITDRKRVARFMQEARAASALNHPNLVAIYEVGEFDTIPFIAMEKVDGATLRELLTAERMDIRRALELMLQVMDAVAAAHAAGIIHRDLKPENIMLAPSGYVKVLDFGLAKLSSESFSDSSRTLVNMTDAGTLIGTAGYMSPEQAVGNRVDHRADIFALGCILYELLAGRRAFSGQTAIDTLHQTVHNEPARLNELVPSLPDEVVRIVRKAITKDADRRYQSVKEMLIDLRDVAAGIKASHSAPSADQASRSKAIAVLPFENATRDAQHDYLVDGLTEILIHQLSEIRPLRVLARSTVFRLRDRDLDPLQCGQQLGVAFVLTGRVTVRGDSFSIDAELIDTTDGACIWGKRFDRSVAEMQTTQDEIAAAISAQLRVKLSPSEDRRLKQRQPVDREAYRLYLLGRFWWNKRPQEGFMKALDFFQKAIDYDPLFALPYSGIADAYATLGSWESGLMAPRDAMPRAKAAALRAIDLDPQLGDPWASLGYILLHYEWNWSESRSAFARAIELNPNCVNAHHWLSHLHTAMEQHDLSRLESVTTSDLDPLDLIANVHLAWHYWLDRDPQNVFAQCQKTATLEPASFWPPFFEGLGYELRGDLGRAAETLQLAVDRVPTATFAVAALANVLARSEHEAEARALLAGLERLSSARYVPAYDRAIIFLGLREMDRVFEWLERAFHERSGWLAYLHVDPRLDPIRHESRFTDLAHRVGLG